MQITKFTKTYRHLKRYRQILMILVKYGFDDVINRLKIEYYIKLGKKVIPRLKERDLEKVTRAQRVRLAFEELGPTFVKLGQMLSVRPDLIPEDFINEFKKLQDEVPPFPVQQAREVIQAQLGAPVEQLFDSFVEEPLAAASIAQVHRAVIENGEQVVVKIQRPNIQKVIETDLSILFDLAVLVERRIPESELYNPVAIVEEFAKTIRRELDFIQEGRNIDRFRRNFAGDDTIYVPKVYWELATDRVLTMEYIDGIKASEIEKLEAAGLDRKIIAVNGAQAILKQVFEHGFFHADPHPGNIFVLENNVIAPLDYGMMGRLDDEMREEVGNLLSGIVHKDADRIISAFRHIGIIEDVSDVRALRRDILDFLDRYYQVPLNQINIGIVINEAMEIVRRHRIKIPSDLTLMGKALATEEGIGRELDPDFDMISLAKPYVQEIMVRKLDPRRYLKDYASTLDEFNRLFKILPLEIRAIITKIKKGELSIKFEHRGLDHLISELDKSSNRLSFSMIIAALIIGSSLIVQLDKGPLVFGFPAIGIVGYLIAAVLGLWLIIAIMRSAKL
ncbi:2-polyprenylphenol 6-hydroxylase [candidate division KSB1 bacterium]|nr:2-polyprenylphenol 6-hydroxylase [candidate division KSB1 bacterium]